MHFVHFSCFAVPSHTAVYLSTPHSHGQCQAELVVDRTMESKEHEDESSELVMTTEGHNEKMNGIRSGVSVIHLDDVIINSCTFPRPPCEKLPPKADSAPARQLPFSPGQPFEEDSSPS